MFNKIIIFSDFDNTITICDILDSIIIERSSYEEYKRVENLLLENSLKYEQYLFDMFDGIEYKLSNISNKLIDIYFKDFYIWIKQNNIDFYIISSGFKKIVQHMLPYVDSGLIFSNDINIDKNNLWTVELYDRNNNCSINKNDIIKLKNKNSYKTIFIGDGLSDFKVMGNVDYLLCKKDSLLHNKCINENCSHITFTNFSEVIVLIQNIQKEI